MYSVKFLNDNEFDTLPYKTGDALGICDRNSGQIYVRSTGVNVFDAMTAMHEIKHMEEGDWDRYQTHQDPEQPGVYYKNNSWIAPVAAIAGSILFPMLAPSLAGTLGGFGSALSGAGSSIAGALGGISPALGGAAQSIGGALGSAGQGLGAMLGIGGGSGAGAGAAGADGMYGANAAINMAPEAYYPLGQNVVGAQWSPEFISQSIAGPSMGSSIGGSMSGGGGLGSAIGAGLGAAGGMMAGGPQTSVSSNFDAMNGGEGGGNDRFDQQNEDQQMGQSFATTPWDVSGLNVYGDQSLQNSPLGYIGKPKEEEQGGGQYLGFMANQGKGGF